MPRFDHFDFAAPFYERVCPPPLPGSLLELLAVFPGARVLDAGGGTGRVAQVVARAGGRLTVIDISRGMLRQARQKGGLAPTQAVVESLPFPAASFDRVLMVNALHHVRDQQQAVLELFRVLRPGGRLVIEEPDREILSVRLLEWAEKILFLRSHFLDSRRLAALFAGLPARLTLRREDLTLWLLAEK